MTALALRVRSSSRVAKWSRLALCFSSLVHGVVVSGHYSLMYQQACVSSAGFLCRVSMREGYWRVREEPPKLGTTYATVVHNTYAVSECSGAALFLSPRPQAAPGGHAVGIVVETASVRL